MTNTDSIFRLNNSQYDFQNNWYYNNSLSNGHYFYHFNSQHNSNNSLYDNNYWNAFNSQNINSPFSDVANWYMQEDNNIVNQENRQSWNDTQYIGDNSNIVNRQDINNTVYLPIWAITTLEEVFEKLTEVWNTEKQKIKTEKVKHEKEVKKFSKIKMKYIQKSNKKIEEWKNILKIQNKEKYHENDTVVLDIGGIECVSVKRSTLIQYPSSILAACFNGNHDNKTISNKGRLSLGHDGIIKLPSRNGKIFIDRDPIHFNLMLQYLTNNSLPIFKTESDEKGFFNEWNYWDIPIFKSKHAFKFDKKWCANTLILDKSSKVLTKNHLNHGIVFMKPEMNAVNSYVEVLISINIQSKNKNHFFIGLVDRSKYLKEYLLSSFWRDSPCSFYWDVQNKQLIKTDEYGKQVKSINDYGCDDDYDQGKFAIGYDQKNRTVSFYKNDVNLGVAFHDVPPNMTPAIDVWFENGIIRICDNTEPEIKIYL